jgi:hypothetical protein
VHGAYPIVPTRLHHPFPPVHARQIGRSERYAPTANRLTPWCDLHGLFDRARDLAVPALRPAGGDDVQ